MFMCMSMHMSMCMSPCMSVHVNVHTHVYTCVCLRIRPHTCLHTCTRTCMHMSAHMPAHISMHIWHARRHTPVGLVETGYDASRRPQPRQSSLRLERLAWDLVRMRAACRIRRDARNAGAAGTRTCFCEAPRAETEGRPRKIGSTRTHEEAL
jgi:hypothetical protein